MVGTIVSTTDVAPDISVGAAPDPEPRIRTAVAVIMTRFPRIDETFILREINELERAGQPVVVVPLIRDHSPVVHEEAKPWLRRALFTPLFSGEIAMTNLRTLFAQPGRYLKLLLTLIFGTIIRPSTLIRTLALFPKSVHLATVLTRMGIRHVHSHFATHATTMAYIISSLSDITYSFTVHGPDVFVHRLLLRKKIEKAIFIRSISLFNQAFLSGLYPVLTEGKIEVVHMGVHPEVYREASEVAPAHPRLQLLSVAAMIRSRGFPFLVDACARLIRDGADIECRIIGDGPLRATTQHWIDANGLGKHVRLLGNLPQHEVARLMGETDVFVLPSIIALDGQMDGIPTSLMEAMAAGKPVVASSISGIPELVRHDVSGVLVDAAHPDRVAAAVRRLMDDPALRARLGRAGQQRVRERFDIRKTSTALIALFDRHANVNRPSPTVADRIRGLNWSRMNAIAVGVRRVHECADSYMAEVTITDGLSKQDVIVRQYRGEHDAALQLARNEFEVLSTLRQSLADPGAEDTGGATYTVPRLLMFDEPNAAVVIERADGSSLASIGNGGRLTAGLRKAGAWLSALQRNTRSDEDGRHVLTAAVLLALRELDLAAAADRVLRPRYAAIHDRLTQLESELAEEPLQVCGHHGNFALQNIFIGSHRVIVSGFGGYREGLPAEDVAEMLVNLELRFPLRRGRLHGLRRAFLDSYAMPVHAKALQLFSRARALQQLARGGASAAQRRVLRRIAERGLTL